MFENLNDKQKEAVEYIDGPLLVLAGAGSGKTRVITTRIAYMISKGIKPSSIVALTFTNKAAREMKERIHNILSKEESIGLITSTFHSFCLRMLRTYYEYAGLEKGFLICDEADKQLLIKKVLKMLNLAEREYPVKYIKNKIQCFKNQTNDLEDETDSNVVQIYEKYQEELINSNSVDFDDIIIKFYDVLINNEEVLKKCQNRFKYFLVDEYQDTNNIQFKVLDMLVRRKDETGKEIANICVVGDDDQSIYAFRGAKVREILDFSKKYENVKIVKLEQNYRSTAEIIEVANNLIRNNVERSQKKLWTSTKTDDRITINKYYSNYEEAREVANSIKIRNSNSVAILYRTNQQAIVMEQELLKNNISYKKIGGLSFYQRADIKDLLAYLNVIVNPDNNISLERIINVPKREIGQTTINKIAEQAYLKGISFFEELKDCHNYITRKVTIENINKFIDIIEKARSLNGTITEFVSYVINEIDYLNYVEDTNRIKLFLEQINSFESKNEDSGLVDFLDEISLYTDADDDSNEDYQVYMMTVHGSKGLEFDEVYIIGTNEGYFPSIRENKTSELEEERRIMYVAITRARKKLFISSFNRAMNRDFVESRFIKELGLEVVSLSNKPSEKKSTYNFNDYKKIDLNLSKPKFDIDYKVGDRVKHLKFKNGVITKIVNAGKDYELTVEFEDFGTKKLMAGFAKLEII